MTCAGRPPAREIPCCSEEPSSPHLSCPSSCPSFFFSFFFFFFRYGAAEWAVGAIFEIAARPVAEFGAFLRAQSTQLFGEGALSSGGIVTARLSHFLFLLGQFAVKIVVLAEELATEVKRRRRAFQKRPKVAAEGATEEEEQKRIEEEMGLNASREKPEDEVGRQAGSQAYTHACMTWCARLHIDTDGRRALTSWIPVLRLSALTLLLLRVLYDTPRFCSVSRIRALWLQTRLLELLPLRWLKSP